MTVILGPVQLALLVSRQFPRPAIQLQALKQTFKEVLALPCTAISATATETLGGL